MAGVVNLIHKLKQAIIGSVLGVSLVLACLFVYSRALRSDARIFAERVEAQFLQEHDGEILVKDVTGFDWDRVCAIGEGDYLPNDGDEEINNFFGKDYKGPRVDLPTFRWFGFSWALVFIDIKNQKIANLFKFGVAWVELSGSKYFFGSVMPYKYYPSIDPPGVDADLPANCFSRENAVIRFNSKSQFLYLGGYK